MGSQTSGWITLLAGLGIGSIVSGALSWWSTKAVTISNHRQNWINALRDDLVTYLKQIDTVHQLAHKVGLSDNATAKDADDLSEARNSAMFVYRRILLRLNMTEALHIELGERLDDLLLVTGHVADAEKVAKVVRIARQVLKNEWAVAKYGYWPPWLSQQRPSGESSGTKLHNRPTCDRGMLGHRLIWSM